MDINTTGMIDVGAVKSRLDAGGKLYLEHPEWPISRIDKSSITKEVDTSRASPMKGSVIIGKNGEILDGRHRIALAISQGKKTISAWVPAEEALAHATDTVKKADRVLNSFVSFKDTGDSMLQLIAQLHTSRLSAYGFVAEADVLGVTEYAVTEQLDKRICPVCKQMHGKVYKVAEAKRALDTILHVENPDDLKTIQSWPKSDPDSVAKLKVMTDDEVYAKNWHLPPYHGGCRGLLVATHAIPAIEDTPSYRKALGNAATSFLVDNNLAQKLKFSDEVLLAWNEVVKLDPRTILKFMSGESSASLGTMLAEKAASISLKDKIVTAYTESELGDLGVDFDVTRRVLSVTTVTGSIKDQLLRVYAVAEEISATAVKLPEEISLQLFEGAKEISILTLKEYLQGVTVAKGESKKMGLGNMLRTW
jgi:hypothetical protein